jgi:hypothetical protein
MEPESEMEAPPSKIDELLRIAIQEKRLIQFVYKQKPRIVEPHDYGVHNGSIKLFGYQVGGLSSDPLPNWRWALVNSISDLQILEQRFSGRRDTPSGRHHRWDQIWARVGTADEASSTGQAIEQAPVDSPTLERACAKPNE